MSSFKLENSELKKQVMQGGVFLICLGIVVMLLLPGLLAIGMAVVGLLMLLAGLGASS